MERRATDLWKAEGKRFPGRKAGAKTQLRRTSVYLGTLRDRVGGAGKEEMGGGGCQTRPPWQVG